MHSDNAMHWASLQTNFEFLKTKLKTVILYAYFVLTITVNVILYVQNISFLVQNEKIICVDEKGSFLKDALPLILL